MKLQTFLPIFQMISNLITFLKQYISQVLKMQEESKNKQIFKKQWNSIYQSKDSKLIMVGNVEGVKVRKQGTHYVLLNKTLANKRESNLMGTKQKTVFIAFDGTKFNFCNISNKEVIFHVNLDQQVIISKEDAHKITQSFFDKQQGGEDDQIQSHTHPLIINTAPVCRFHSLLSMYPDEELPQVVGSDIMLLLLNIFRILPNLRVGYNSIGAAASVNHLHFHIVYPDDMVQDKSFPVQNYEQVPWLKSSLSNPGEQINLYTVPICINQIVSNGVHALVLKPYAKQNQKLQFAQVTNSLSFVFGIIANQLIQLNIPHNLLITNNGESIYIFLRDFCSPTNVYGWIQFSGVILAADEKQFQMKQPDIIQKKKSLALEKSIVQLLKTNIKKHLSKFA